MITRHYLTQQAATLLKLAQITSSQKGAEALKLKAAELQARAAEIQPQDLSPQAPDPIGRLRTAPGVVP